MTIFRAALVWIFAFTLTAHAGELELNSLGPDVGEPIPHDLQTTDTGANFDALVGEKGLALFFIRSLDWCPFCKNQAIDVNDRLADFEDRGLNVAFVSYDTPSKQIAFAEKTNFQPALVSDEEINVINAFGLRNETHEEGSRFHGIPHPAVFIITPDKKIAAKLYEEDYASNEKSYRNRPAVDVILEKVDTVLTNQN
ncbi:MAG: peroxiredoxin family protein [Pseudomonadota bacterium]